MIIVLDMPNKGNSTLKNILDLILYENPATQDEIADKLGITRRYVTQLIQPLIKEGTIKRGYMIDLKAYEKLAESLDDSISSKDYSADLLITTMLKSMTDQVRDQLNVSFTSILENDIVKAEKALEMDYVTNNMLEKIRTSVETVVSINQNPTFSKSVLFNEVAYNLERIGDYCGHIAKFTINEVYEIDEDILKNLKKMHTITQKMIELSMKGFLKAKLKYKENIMDFEESLHSLQNKSLNKIAIEMAESSFEDKERSNYYIYLSRVIKAFERIGDISIEIIDAASEFHKNIPRSKTPRSFRE